MSNIHHLNPHNNADEQSEDIILDQACDWITKIDRELSKKEHSELKEWLTVSSKHFNTFIEVAKMWDKTEELSRLSDIFPESEFSNANSNTKQNDVVIEPNATQQTKSKVWLGAVAASVLFAVSIGMYSNVISLSPFTTTSQNAVVAMQANYQTSIGESSTINLPDNSKIVLNTNSFVQVKYTKSARIIELQRGEIHIDVAHDKSRPLSVVAGGKVIQAVGTAFNVEVKDSIVELIVTDGKVLVAKTPLLPNDTNIANVDLVLPRSSLAISKGEKVDLDGSGKEKETVVKVDEVDIAAKLSWRSGNIIFRGESLAEAMAEISRYTKIEFELAEDEKLKDVQVAGMFKTGDVNGLLDVLSQNFNISHERLNDAKIVLKYSG